MLFTLLYMKESEYAENNVDAKVIIATVLKTLKLGNTDFAAATGIAYQRIYDLVRGRTKKFNPGVVNQIIAAFPQIRKEYLYTGEGPVLQTDIPVLPANQLPSDPSALLAKVLEMQTELLARMERLTEREAELHRREIELMRKETEINVRMKMLSGNHTDKHALINRCGNE